MSNDSIRQVSNSQIDLAKRHIKYVVDDKVKTQVVDSNNGKVVREIPRKLSSNIMNGLYA